MSQRNGVPLIEFDAAGEAAVLNYNLPQPTSYRGRSVIEFDYPLNYFRSSVQEEPDQPLREFVEEIPLDELTDRIANGIENGFYDPVMFRGISDDIGLLGENLTYPIPERFRFDHTGTDPDERVIDPTIVRDAITDDPVILDRLVDNLRDDPRIPISDGGTAVSHADLNEIRTIPDTDYLMNKYKYRLVYQLEPELIARRAKAGQYLTFNPTLAGDYVPSFVPELETAEPRLALIETHHISNFLGDFGAGRTVKTASLYPGEKTTISTKTYKSSERTHQEAQNILESLTREAALEFETTLNQMHSSSAKASSSRQFSSSESSVSRSSSHWNAGGNAGFDLFGVISFGGGGGGGGSGSTEERSSSRIAARTNAAREEATKTVSNAVSQHAQKSSAKRRVNVNTETTFEEKQVEEESLVREIENINLSRTLNLVFRQMNQEFITLIHQTDVRVAYSDGFPGSYREIPLYALDDLLEEIIREDHREQVKEELLATVQSIYDYEGEEHTDFVIQTSRDDFEYHRVNDDVEMTYVDDQSGSAFRVPGIITSATSNVIRTDGIIVEALLGEGEALDSYSQGLQTESVESRALANELLREEGEQSELARMIVNEEDNKRASEMAEIFEIVFPESKNTDEKENE
jgi:flavodoxin